MQFEASAPIGHTETSCCTAWTPPPGAGGGGDGASPSLGHDLTRCFICAATVGPSCTRHSRQSGTATAAHAASHDVGHPPSSLGRVHAAVNSWVRRSSAWPSHCPASCCIRRPLRFPPPFDPPSFPEPPGVPAPSSSMRTFQMRATSPCVFGPWLCRFRRLDKDVAWASHASSRALICLTSASVLFDSWCSALRTSTTSTDSAAFCCRSSVSAARVLFCRAPPCLSTASIRARIAAFSRRISWACPASCACRAAICAWCSPPIRASSFAVIAASSLASIPAEAASGGSAPIGAAAIWPAIAASRRRSIADTARAPRVGAAGMLDRAGIKARARPLSRARLPWLGAFALTKASNRIL